jgi:hypothetical protein
MLNKNIVNNLSKMNSKKKYDNMKEDDDEDELEITMDL